MCFQTVRVTHKIDTGDQKPIKQPPRRLPLAKVDIAQKATKEMHEQGVVEPTFWVDYRKLNKVD